MTLLSIDRHERFTKCQHQSVKYQPVYSVPIAYLFRHALCDIEEQKLSVGYEVMTRVHKYTGWCLLLVYARKTIKVKGYTSQ